MSAKANGMEKPLVSVIVPIYNVEKYLRQCIDSIVNQTLKDLEIILINDGSKDSSLDIIKEYASADRRIIVIDKQNSGYGHSMNMGLSKASGKYVGIVESDDWIEPDMFETLYNLSEKDDLDISRSEFFFYSTVDGEKNDISKTPYVPHDKVISPCEERSVFMQQPSIWANLYLRSFLEENEIRFLETPGASYQDTSFSFKVYACASRFEMIGRAFYHYRIDGGSSSFQNTTKVYCVCDEYEEIWRYTRKHGLYEQYRHLIPKMQFNGYKWNYERLAQPYCDEFFMRWHEEFVKLDEAGDLDSDSYSGLNRKLISDVLSGDLPDRSVPLVSIVVPVYNVEQYLPKCLDSLINQTLKNIEIICVNDGSTDGSLDILKEYEKKDTRIRIICKKNGGQSSARNMGMAVARAEYMGFLDSDDWVEPDTYECAYVSIKSADMVCFGTNIVGDTMIDRRDADRKYYRVKYRGLQPLTDDIRLNTDVSVWNKLFSTKIIRDNDLQFPTGRLYEDYSFCWKYMLLCNTAYYIPEYKHNYLRREGSTMANTFNTNKRAMDHLSIFLDLYRFAEGKQLWDGREDTLNSMFLNCFWFAYINVPDGMKKKVMMEGSRQVRAMNLSGNPVIDSLRRKEYDKVDKHRNYKTSTRMLKSAINWFERAIGGDLSTMRKMLFGTYRAYDDCSNSVATTEWVNRHELDYRVERWAILYDSNSEDASVNWNKPAGLTGADCVMIPDHRRCAFKTGTELKIVMTLWGAESASLQGVIMHDSRFICGTSFYDGTSVFVISVDACPITGELHMRGINTTAGVDISNNCRIIRIESRVY